MREHLLGYLMQALEPSEARLVEGSLAEDPELRRELEALRQCLEPLAIDAGHLAPSEGLAARTCRYVAAHAQTTQVRPAPLRGWSFADLVVAAGVLIAASMVFFPALSQRRYTAQLTACQNNFRQLGLAMMEYSQQNGGYFPRLETEGKRAVAGYYAPMLRQAGYLQDDSMLVCPGSALAREGTFRTTTDAEIELAEGSALEDLHSTMGGSYGYSLGVKVNGRYQPVKNQGRANFALMSDSPRPRSPRSQTNSENHGGCGQNVLFEDGHVRFLRSCRQCEFTDDYFHNAAGVIAAGVHLDDAVIGHSATPPLGWQAGPPKQ